MSTPGRMGWLHDLRYTLSGQLLGRTLKQFSPALRYHPHQNSHL